MKKETTGQKAKRSALEAALWVGALVLGLALAGAFVFVIFVLVSAPSAPFVSQSTPAAPKKKKKPARVATPPAPKPAASTSTAKPVPGLVGRYFRFDKTITDLPKLEGRKEHFRKTHPTIDFESTERGFAGTALTENFAVRWEGLIRIPKDGRYTFFTISDDGSWLYLGGKPVVRNAGLHSMEEQRGQVDLKKGDHEIRIDFFEGSGGAGCKVLWQGPDLPKAVIPASVLFHRPRS